MSASADYKKLASIYDALDSGAHRAALQTCNKLLKKNPKSQIIRALKSLALYRSGKLQDASQECDEVLKEHPTDHDVLSTLALTLRQLTRHGDAVNMYEDAFKKTPNNEELGVQTFFANIRVGSWKAAQQISLKLSKAYLSNFRYVFWSATSAYLQAGDPATAPAVKPMLLTLALRMLSQLPPAQDSLSSPEKLSLHIEILLSYDEPKLQDAYDLLSSERGRSLARFSLAIEERRSEIWLKLKKFPEEKELSEKKLASGDRNWLTFLSYVQSITGLCSSLEDEPSTSLANDAFSLLSSLASKDGETERGAHLAVLELSTSIKKLNKDSITIPQPLPDAIRAYFDLFSNKPCCFEDLKPYIVELVDEEKEAVSSFLASQKLSVSTSNELRRTVNVIKFVRYMQLGSSDELEDGVRYFQMYLTALPLGRNLPTTELQPADDLALLAANCFVQSWADQGKRNLAPLHQAMVVLEFASQHSATNFQVRLLLIRIYILLGAYSLAVQHYKKLDIKSVQNETLSHFILSRATSFSLANNGDLSVLEEAVLASQIYQENINDTPGLLIKVFLNEKYSQIPGFILFEDRLDRSLQRHLVKIDQLRMRLLVEPPTHETLPAEIEDLDLMHFGDIVRHDNRDYSVLPHYQRRGISVEEQLSAGPRQTAHWYSVFLKIYLRAMNRAFDPAFSSPMLFSPSRGDGHDLTEGEALLERYSDVLGSCLHPPSGSVNAKDVTDKYFAGSGAGVRSQALANGKGANGDVPSVATSERDSATLDDALQLVDELTQKVTRSTEGDSLPWEVLHSATLAQEAFVLFDIQSHQFGPVGWNGKSKKTDPLWLSIKAARTTICEKLKTLASLLQTYATSHGSEETRAKFIEDSNSLYSEEEHGELSDFAATVWKNYLHARQVMFENMSNGLRNIAEEKRPNA
ncbi:N-acetyltransferase B complex non catalytic subunit-domain-containing protein [Cantharellus anzutake]|uniref:N-acetyltransferase B complex non catalytic subunit-domain-containing protein n=1 Tax=Cantharellus anzutake TaxID=1750568 RepID=UPI0019045CC2|nr:N-acetyltransferase B complex non catalytic subunit-domain-containing protein [Cantharellus anzutake]KAF8325563.1 N-acetyltransferase B complex non catalytic subunit-domain-containing protein [Cantharellus anzutake]